MIRPLILSFSLVLLTQAHATGLPDTGQDTCDDGANNLVVCSSANTGDGATYPRQDGRFGRDPNAAAGTLVKAGAGSKGFDYTKVANNGSDLAAGVALGVAFGDWACTRDNVTGLVWEVKSPISVNSRYMGHTYTWYSTAPTTNGGDQGDVGTFTTCGGWLTNCNTQTYVAAVNAANLCGNGDWRLPTRRELLTLRDVGSENPAIDTNYFPNTASAAFWTATTYPNNTANVYVPNFASSTNVSDSKTNTNRIRLVRGGPF